MQKKNQINISFLCALTLHFMEVNKRKFQQTSPDIFAQNTPKKHQEMNGETPRITEAAIGPELCNTAQAATKKPSTTGDSFSWAVFDSKLNTALDNKLENVVKKEDILTITTDIQQLRNENTRLQNELISIKSRLEHVDKISRRNNIIISGLTSRFVPQALNEFGTLCNTTLNVSVNVVEVRKISNGKSFILTLNSPMEVNAVLSCRRSLSGSNIYIDKDYTADERNKRYFLRQIGKNVKKADKNVKIRYGDHRIFINDKAYTYVGDKVIASNKPDAEFLQKMFANVNFACKVDVNEPQTTKNVYSTATSSSSSTN